MAECKYYIDGNNAELYVFEDRIIIDRKRLGLSGIFNKEPESSHTIPMSSVRGVQFQPTGLVAAGFLYFDVAGSMGFSGRVLDAVGNMNAVVFKGEEEATAQAIERFVIDAIAKQQTINSAEATSEDSGADEIRKFKVLLDDGIISAEEFEAKKKQILGI